MTCEIQVRTILQHVWAEIEHDIQYKSSSDIPKELKRKFQALAGLIEIADREFQSIQDMDDGLRSAIQKSATDALTKETISHLSADNIKTKDNSSDLPTYGIVNLESARSYIIAKNYEEALRVYSNNIKLSPSAHTQYLGRAKVRFLLGDLPGALTDLEAAERLLPGDRATAVVRSQIQGGEIVTPQLDSEGAAEDMRQGNLALSEGQGESAFIHYSSAYNKGYNFAYATFNMAMACVLAGDLSGGRAQLSLLKKISGSPMEINIVSLYCIMDKMNNIDNEKGMDDLRRLVRAMPEFNLSLSPLRYLQRGMTKVGKNYSIDIVFNMLSRIAREIDGILGEDAAG